MTARQTKEAIQGAITAFMAERGVFAPSSSASEHVGQKTGRKWRSYSKRAGPDLTEIPL